MDLVAVVLKKTYNQGRLEAYQDIWNILNGAYPLKLKRLPKNLKITRDRVIQLHKAIHSHKCN